jgi:hypothetical protein
MGWGHHAGLTRWMVSAGTSRPGGQVLELNVDEMRLEDIGQIIKFNHSIQKSEN